MSGDCNERVSRRTPLARVRRALLVAAVALVTLAGGGKYAFADRILLKSGGELDGVVLPREPARPTILRVMTATAPRPFEFRTDQVARVEPQADRLRTYADRLEQLKSTAQSEFDLGLWCEETGLPGPARWHFGKAVELDPDFGPAREKIGHVLHNGRWMSRDERAQAQGLVKHKGRWVSTQEKEILEARLAFTKEQSAWSGRLKSLRRDLAGTEPARAQRADALLGEIQAPEAVAPLLNTFGGDGPEARRRLSQIFGAIPGQEAREGLIRLLLAEHDVQLRQLYLNELRTRGETEVASRLIKALDAKDVLVVGRAAWALGQLGVKAAVPKLVKVLVRMETRFEFVPAAGPGGTPIGVGFGGIVGSSPYPAGSAGLAVPGAAASVGGGSMTGGSMVNGSNTPAFGTIYPVPILTGPVVGPGAVAFGATSVPLIDGVQLGNGNPNRPTAQQITMVYRNEEVLRALEMLTEVNFGYDQPTWRRWLATRFRADETPSRRVPQP